LTEQLLAYGFALDCLHQGRLFVDGKRCLDSGLWLEAGQRVEVQPSREPHRSHSQGPAAASGAVETPGGAPGEPGYWRLLHHDEGWLVVDKAAGIPSEPDRRGVDDSLVARVARSLGLSQLHVCGRLDLGVSGVVLLAEGEAARRRWQQLQETKTLRKLYVALATSPPSPAEGRWTTPIVDPRGQPRAAETAYRVVATVGTSFPGRAESDGSRDGRRQPTFASSLSLVALAPATGRYHQLRQHLADAGAPLLGDRRRGAATRWLTGTGGVRELGRVALHAYALSGLGSRVWSAPFPEELSAAWADFGDEATLRAELQRLLEPALWPR